MSEAKRQRNAEEFKADPDTGFYFANTANAVPAAEGIESTRYIPQWGLDVIRATIEACRGVRLAGAKHQADYLEATYFPDGEDEEGEE
jgi:hypothetical protein